MTYNKNFITVEAAFMQLCEKYDAYTAFEFLSAIESLNNPLCWIRFERKHRFRITFKGETWQTSGAGNSIEETIRRIKNKKIKHSRQYISKQNKNRISCFHNVYLA